MRILQQWNNSKIMTLRKRLYVNHSLRVTVFIYLWTYIYWVYILFTYCNNAITQKLRLQGNDDVNILRYNIKLHKNLILKYQIKNTHTI